MRSLAIAVVAAVALAADRGQTLDQRQRAQIHYRLGWDALRREDWTAAEREFRKALEFHSRFNLAYYGLGKAYMGMKNFQSAARAFTSCRDLYAQRASTEVMDQLARNQRREEQLFELRQILRDYATGSTLGSRKTSGRSDRRSSHVRSSVRVK